jgi:hypothetical protein
MSGMALGFVRGKPCLSSCRVMASDLYISLNGVNLVARDSGVLSAQMTSGNCSAHLPFLSTKSLFFMALKILPLACSATQLVKYLTATKANLRLPCAVGNGLTISRPHHCSCLVWAMSFVNYEGAPVLGKNVWHASHERTTRLTIHTIAGQ